jgi:hypothetical protein
VAAGRDLALGRFHASPLHRRPPGGRLIEKSLFRLFWPGNHPPPPPRAYLSLVLKRCVVVGGLLGWGTVRT